MTDEKSANYAVEVLRQKHDRPFLLMVGFCKPHAPLVAPQKYFDLFKGVKNDLPPYLANDLDDCAKPLRAETSGMRTFKAVKSLGEDYWKDYIRAYLACTAFMDDQLGQVLTALAASPYADNTIIVFIGDNGYHLGEKDTIDKMTVWNPSTLVPMVVHAPGMKTGGKVCPQPVSLIDLYPTLIDLCGLPANPNGADKLPLDGHSLRPLLTNPNAADWGGPAVALTAWMGQPTKEQRADCIAPAAVKDQHFTVCSKRYRYILCNDGEEEFYDHQRDPNEWTNRAADVAFTTIKSELRAQLESLIATPKKP